MRCNLEGWHIALEFTRILLSAPVIAGAVLFAFGWYFHEEIKQLLKRLAKIKFPGGTEVSMTQLEQAMSDPEYGLLRVEIHRAIGNDSRLKCLMTAEALGKNEPNVGFWDGDELHIYDAETNHFLGLQDIPIPKKKAA